MKIMTKIKELLAGREKLAKYDKLKAVLDFYKGLDPNIPINLGTDGETKVAGVSFEIIQIIITALEAEIAKLDEE